MKKQSSNALVPFNPTKALTFYDNAKQALEKAVRIDDVRKIKGMSKAAQSYAAEMHDNTLRNNAAEIQERAERRMGELIVKMRASGELDDGKGGDRKSASSRTTLILTLDDLGISRDESARCQLLAGVSAEELEKALAAERAKGLITTAGLLRELRGGDDSAEADDDEFVPPEGIYDALIISPPFATLTIKKIICDVDRLVKGSTATNAWVWFRAANAFLPEVLDLIAFASLDYRLILAMREPFNQGLGFTLVATKGRPKPDALDEARWLTCYPEFSIEGFDRWPA